MRAEIIFHRGSPVVFPTVSVLAEFSGAIILGTMIEKTIGEIEAKIRDADSVGGDRKRELLQLVATLKTEVANLSKTDAEHARSIAGFANVSAHEATRKNQNPRLLEHSLAGLRSSVKGFEQSHPHLVQIVNRLCNTLSDWGI